ncbi:carbohydrate ABC transporter permease [Paenibacillus piri]|uniref:Carbohydrate ABC transporter permease n=1 Tax=Paenibacillus piri TaxID=2547395 RepID=A0A4R5KX50_9BACL|nr:carbohydrate ABC transporter permease [Paenibacillus piri]TDG00153.1 carbohydrate ABC transporter permease [Paenibacillus piri]
MNKNRKLLLLDVLMLPLCLIMLFPFYYMAVNTFKTQMDANEHPLSLPTAFTLDNYRQVFAQTPVFQSFFNSLFITSASVLLIVLIGAMAAYPIVFNPNRLMKAAMYYLLCGFLIPFQATLIPLFELMRDLNLVNSMSGLVVFYTSGSVFSFFLIMGYMRTVPKELSEAAIIDGCSVGGIFWRIIVPLLKPITTTAVIYHTMWIWNDFLAPMLFLNSRKKATLVLEIYQARGQFSVDWPTFMSLTVLVLLPILVFFIVMQKHIIKGLVGGAMKG